MIELIEKLKEFFSKLLTTANFSVKSFDIKQEDEETLRADVFIENAGLIIGENGENLFCWESILEQWVKQQFKSELRIVVDVNNYRWQNEQKLRELAKRSAREVVLNKALVKLRPMSSYERRIIHMELALHPGVATESEGQGQERHVVVKPL
jgi:spoIIIJ-associated protein